MGSRTTGRTGPPRSPAARGPLASDRPRRRAHSKASDWIGWLLKADKSRGIFMSEGKSSAERWRLADALANLLGSANFPMRSAWPKRRKAGRRLAIFSPSSGQARSDSLKELVVRIRSCIHDDRERLALTTDALNPNTAAPSPAPRGGGSTRPAIEAERVVRRISSRIEPCAAAGGYLHPKCSRCDHPQFRSELITPSHRAIESATHKRWVYNISKRVRVPDQITSLVTEGSCVRPSMTHARLVVALAEWFTSRNLFVRHPRENPGSGHGNAKTSRRGTDHLSSHGCVMAVRGAGADSE